MPSFAEAFHEAVSKLEAWLEAPPPDCLGCEQPYADHSMQELLRSENDPPETWYTEFGEGCPNNTGDIYANPEAFEDDA
jgi:hypothetical protein